MHEDDDLPGDPACHAHRLIGGHLIDEQTYLDVRQFRTSERERLYQKRRQQSQSDRETATSALIARLREVLTDRHFETIAVYWPIRGEPDLRPLMSELDTAGKTVLLPVVLDKKAPLLFRPWSPGCGMIRGTWNILVPADGPPRHPQIVIAPVLGIDRDLYRLGNGGGYYDRTLASLSDKPLVVGVGFALSQIETIFPMAWDIPMDVAVTDREEIC